MSFTDKTIEILARLYPHSEEMPSLYQQILHFSEEDDILSRLQRPIIEFWKGFVFKYQIYYSIFERNVLLIGEEVAQQRKRIEYSKLVDVFQLKAKESDKNENTPPKNNIDLNEELFELVHIRNAIAHLKLRFDVENDVITLWDETNKHKETYRKTLSKKDLLQIEYRLFLASLGLEKVAIYYSVIRHLTHEFLKNDPSFKTMFLCPQCRAVFFQFILPDQPSVKCDFCNFEIDLSNTMRLQFPN